MKTPSQKKQIIDAVQSFLAVNEVVSVFPSSYLAQINRQRKIFVNGSKYNERELENILFVFASQNGFVTDNYIGFAEDLVKQLKSDAKTNYSAIGEKIRHKHSDL